MRCVRYLIVLNILYYSGWKCSMRCFSSLNPNCSVKTEPEVSRRLTIFVNYTRRGIITSSILLLHISPATRKVAQEYTLSLLQSITPPIPPLSSLSFLFVPHPYQVSASSSNLDNSHTHPKRMQASMHR